MPVLFLVGNRALDDPGAFGVEHNDAMAVRDMGWLLAWVTTPQEALEHVLLGYRIAEDKRVRMPMALAMDGADTILIGLGTVCAPGRTACRRLREKGEKVGFVSLRWFRPFPTIELRESLQRFKVVGVIDRDFAHGSPDDGGILMHEVRSALYPLKNRPAITNVITGLGGRDVSIEDCARMYEIAQRSKTEDKLDNFVTWIGVRE